jgi:hypothetical protein
MKRPSLLPPKFDLLALQTTLELAAGAVLTAMLLRWVM